MNPIVIITILLFFLNDFAFKLFERNTGMFLLSDYLPRILVLFVGYFLYRERIKEAMTIRKSDLTAILSYSIVILAIDVFLIRPFGVYLSGHFTIYRFYEFPQITNTLLSVFDFTIGILLVALSEEILFRVILIEELEKKIKSRAFVLLISTIIFSLMHWGAGSRAMFDALLAGSIYGFYYMKKRNIIPLVITHYIFDLLIFTNKI